MIILESVQGTDGWLKDRIGLPTASKFSEIVTSKGEPSKSREKYLYQLAAERLSGTKEDTYKNAAMDRGIELEAAAREKLSFIEGVEIIQVGFCKMDDGLCGCSPDGLIGEDGGCEIKNPLSHTHIKYLRENRLPTDYFQQVHGSMFVTKRPWWIFMSNYPGIKPLILKIYRDEKFIDKLKMELISFNQELESLVNELK